MREYNRLTKEVNRERCLFKWKFIRFIEQLMKISAEICCQSQKVFDKWLTILFSFFLSKNHEYRNQNLFQNWQFILIIHEHQFWNEQNLRETYWYLGLWYSWWMSSMKQMNYLVQNDYEMDAYSQTIVWLYYIWIYS